MSIIYLALFAILYHLYVIYIIMKRIYNVKKVNEEVLSKEDKETYLKSLNKYKYTALASFAIIFISFIIPDIRIAMIFPFVAIFVLTKVHSIVIDEIDAYDLNRKDMERVLEHKRKIKYDVAKKNLIQEKRNH